MWSALIVALRIWKDNGRNDISHFLILFFYEILFFTSMKVSKYRFTFIETFAIIKKRKGHVNGRQYDF